MSSTPETTGRPAVVLLSGGLDSATAAVWAQREGFKVHALSFRYGQRHAVELQFAAALAAQLGLAGHRVLDLPLGGPGGIGGSALTDPERTIPQTVPDPLRIPETYVPARNLIFLSVAAAFAETLGASDLVIGANAVDYSGYPDCRPPFLEAVEQALAEGTRLGSLGAAWRIHAPLISWRKPAILRHGLAWGVPYAWTTSCYDPGEGGVPCARCESCQIRSAAFAEIGQADPLVERLQADSRSV